MSCPEGQQLQGEATVICDPSLNFSPNPADITCIKGKFHTKVRERTAKQDDICAVYCIIFYIYTWTLVLCILYTVHDLWLHDIELCLAAIR